MSDDLPAPWHEGHPPVTGHYLVRYGDRDGHPDREYMRLVHVCVVSPEGNSDQVDPDGMVRYYDTHFGPGLGYVGQPLGWCLPTPANFAVALADQVARWTTADRVGRERAAALGNSTTGAG